VKSVVKLVVKKRGAALAEQPWTEKVASWEQMDAFSRGNPKGFDAHHTTMLLPSLTAILGLLSLATAHNVQLKANSRECFHEQLHADDKMTVTFQVGDREFGGAGNLEIDFWVSAIMAGPYYQKNIC
jgi:emp24/gp25L/p24 family/GOLD